jgi:hypothetical protein
LVHVVGGVGEVVEVVVFDDGRGAEEAALRGFAGDGFPRGVGREDFAGLAVAGFCP